MGRRHADLIESYRVTNAKRFRLKDVDPDDTGGLPHDMKDDAADILREDVARLADLQEKLYAQDHWAVLIVLQAMDAAGKDSTIEHVMSGVNPQGVDVTSFKAPSVEELDHDFLWRAARALPERGRIGIFNRSYYEELLVVRVHPELLDRQHLPPERCGKGLWKQRFEDVRNWEAYLDHNGVVIRKFFLHVSRKEQKRRFLARLDEPEKNWKFSVGDVHERDRWDDYMDAFEDMIRHTATKHAPWFVVPADNKWFTRLVVGAAIVETLESLNLKFPTVDARRHRELVEARAMLVGKKDKDGG